MTAAAGPASLRPDGSNVVVAASCRSYATHLAQPSTAGGVVDARPTGSCW